MKAKLFTFLLALVASVGMMNAEMYSGQCGDNLSWSFDTTDSTLVIFGNGAMTDWNLNIDVAWKDYRDNIANVSIQDGVSSIGGWAFAYCPNLKSITIPESVTYIGSYAFYDCPIILLTIPATVTSIETGAFYHVANVVYSGPATGSWFAKCLNGYVEGDLVYNDNSRTILCACSVWAIGEINIPNGVTSIQENAFSKCKKITSVSIPGSVLIIKREAFSECAQLQSVTIGEGLQGIEEHAFWRCENLSTINLPNSVTQIGNKVFEGCNKISQPLYNQTFFVYMPSSYKGAYSIQDGITTIAEQAFENCSKLSSIYIPSSVTNIRYGAFYHCDSLRTIEVDAQNTIYDSRENCNAIIETATNKLLFGCQNTIIPQGIVILGNSAFHSCVKLSQINIPNSVAKIENECFDGAGLTSIVIPNSVEEIGGYAFCRCSNMTTIIIGAGVKSIDGCAFAACPSLQSITCKAINPPTLHNGTSTTFNGDDYSIPVYVPCNSVGAYQSASLWPFNNYIATFFDFDINLITDSMQGSALVLSKGTSCSNPEAYIQAIPNEGYHFVQWSDGNTDNPRMIVARKDTTLTAIFESDNCILASGTCGAEGDNLTWELSCDSVLTISGAGAMAVYTWDAYDAPWQPYKSYMTSVIINDGVTTIGSYAFQKCTYIKSVSIPNSVTVLGHGAFKSCSSLIHVTIPENLARLTNGGTSFQHCNSMQSVIWNAISCVLEQHNSGSYYPPFLGLASITTFSFGKKVEVIPRSLCDGLTGLTSVELPSSVKEIGTTAFRNCSGLTMMSCYAVTPPALGENVFRNVDKSIPLYVPCESVEAYQAADQWSEFTNIQAISSIIASGTCGAEGDNLTWEFSCDSVLTINGTGAMADFVLSSGAQTTAPWSVYRLKVKRVIISEGVTTIGKSAFRNCNNLVAVTIPEGVSEIRNWAFENCHSLRDIKLPESLLSIGQSAFQDCASLRVIEFPSSIQYLDNVAYSVCMYSGTPALTAIICHAVTPPSLGYSSFDCVSRSIPLYVPAESIDAYKAANQWKDFTNIHPIAQEELNQDSSSMPTDIQQYTQEGIVKVSSNTKNISIPVSYVAYLSGGCMSDQYCEVFLTSPSGNEYILAAHSNNENYFLHSTHPLYGNSTLVDSYYFFDLQKKEKGTWTLTLVQSNVGEWYYLYQGSSEGGQTSSEDTIKVAGALSGLFSVGDNKKVCFSKGNLQYQASTNTWRFAEHQYDFVGLDNANISSTYDGWIDLFGWGTGNNPTNTSANNADYSTFVEWGTNAISNGGNKANQWHTLAKEEWGFLFELRENATQLFGFGTINGIEGVIILPDNWNSPQNVSFVSASAIGLRWNEYDVGNDYRNDNADNFAYNTYSLDDWNYMEAQGAVFMPTAGRRYGTDIYSSTGEYWSSTSDAPYHLGFHYYCLGAQYNDISSANGLSVRLVTDQTSASDLEPTEPETISDDTIKIDGALPGLFSVGDNKKVCFSKGNLQYQASTNTWRFAENQWDFVGNKAKGTVYENDVKCCNNYISNSYSGWIDLFGWGTGDNPTLYSTNLQDYGTFTDWGVNQISNGGNATNQWRTLTASEWSYLFSERDDANNKKGQATVNNVPGYVYLPDSWTLPYGLSFIANAKDLTTNVYTAEQWVKMENAGAIFLPAAGYRCLGVNVLFVCESSGYWLSTSYEDDSIRAWHFFNATSDGGAGVSGDNRDGGQSVRLILDYSPCILVSGTCGAEGDNLKWELSCDSVLTISGTGAMAEYSPDSRPWSEIIEAIKSVVIDNGVTSIGDSTFYNCSRLAAVTIPNSVTSIGVGTFAGCSSLASVTIPNSVASIGYGAFAGCSDLTAMTVDAANTEYDSRDNCNAIIETGTNTLISGCKNTLIPSSVTSIGKGAFYECTGLTSVTIPGSVTSIGYGAFANCSNLTSIDIPNGVTSIGMYAFWGCSNLSSIVIPNGVTSIEYCTFGNCSSLTSINIPNGVTSIGEYAFWECRNLGSIVIPGSVTSIGARAFGYCTGLTSVDISDGVTSIGDYAFGNCTGLTSVDIPGSVTSIGYGAFGYCSSLTSLTCEATTPPTLTGILVFYKIDKSIPVLVPCESVGAYKAATQWKDFTNVRPLMNSYSVSSSDDALGSVAITHEPVCADLTLSFTATPAQGCEFLQWSDGNTDNPRSLTLVQDMVITAQWVKLYTITWKDADGTTLATYTVHEGATPVAPANPTKAADAEYIYTFSGWSPDIVAAEADATYTATYLAVPNLKLALAAIAPQCYPANEIDVAYTAANADTITYTVKHGDVLMVDAAKIKISASSMFTINVEGFAAGEYTIEAYASTNGYVSETVAQTFSIYGATNVDESATICENDSLLWRGKWLKEAATYYDTVRYAGCLCDSIWYTLNLSVAEKFEFEETYPIFETELPYTVHGCTYTKAGTFDCGFTTVNGCDSIYHITIVVLRTGEDSLSVEGVIPAESLDLGVNSAVTINSQGHLVVSSPVYVHTLTLDYSDAQHAQVSGIGNIHAEVVEVLLNFPTPIGPVIGHWYSFAVPFEVSVATGIRLAGSDTPARYGYDFVIDEFDGAQRATIQQGWKRVGPDAILRPGSMYMFASAKDATSWILTAADPSEIIEQTGTDISENSSSIGANHSGWNGIANPMFANATADMSGVTLITTYNNVLGVYETCEVSEFVFMPSTPFFVQVAESATFEFNDIPLYAPRRAQADNEPSVFTKLMLTDAEEIYTDKAYISFVTDKEDTYLIGHDLQKMAANSQYVHQLWWEAYGMQLAAYETSFVGDGQIIPLGMYAPADGMYTIAISNVPAQYDITLMRNGQAVWTISESAYTASLHAGNNADYALRISHKKDVITDLNTLNGGSAEVRKLIVDGQLYILRGDKTYTVQGQELK